MLAFLLNDAAQALAALGLPPEARQRAMLFLVGLGQGLCHRLKRGKGRVTVRAGVVWVPFSLQLSRVERRFLAAMRAGDRDRVLRHLANPCFGKDSA